MRNTAHPGFFISSHLTIVERPAFDEVVQQLAGE
jgi:hypothetical protein